MRNPTSLPYFVWTGNQNKQIWSITFARKLLYCFYWKNSYRVCTLIKVWFVNEVACCCTVGFALKVFSSKNTAITMNYTCRKIKLFGKQPIHGDFQIIMYLIWEFYFLNFIVLKYWFGILNCSGHYNLWSS